MLPMPPSTAAVNAAIPGRNPIVNCTCSKVRENNTPAMPATKRPTKLHLLFARIAGASTMASIVGPR